MGVSPREPEPQGRSDIGAPGPFQQPRPALVTCSCRGLETSYEEGVASPSLATGTWACSGGGVTTDAGGGVTAGLLSSSPLTLLRNSLMLEPMPFGQIG